MNKIAIRTPEDMWYDSQHPVILPTPNHNSTMPNNGTIQQIPVYLSIGKHGEPTLVNGKPDEKDKNT